MQKKLSFYLGLAMRGCTIAILVIFAFYLVLLALPRSTGYAPAMVLADFLTLTLFSLVLSFAAPILSLSGLHPLLRYLLHFSVVGVALFFVLLVKTQAYLVGFLLYAVAYAAATLALFLFRRMTGKKRGASGTARAEKDSYQSRFS